VKASFVSVRGLGLATAISTLALAASCGTNSSLSPSNADNANLVTVFIKNSAYSPNPARVKVGQSVNWKNDDGIEHSATSTSGPVTFETGNIPANSAKNAPVVMATTGTVTYRCRLHGETGSIIIEQ
jgi:plastocyanin